MTGTPARAAWWATLRRVDADEVRGGRDVGAQKAAGPAELAGGHILEDASDAALLEIRDEVLQDDLHGRRVGLDDDAGSTDVIHG
jgi:hypothetical protein